MYKKIRNNRLSVLLLVMAVAAAMLLAGCGGSSSDEDTGGGGTEIQELGKAADPMGIHHAEIDVADYGTIKLELDGDEAPVTVKNFMDLAESGFYDGLTFHRIIDGFMIQGGDPQGNGTGGSDSNIVGEFTANGYENNISHKEGVISMARSQDPNSGSSQFFIMVDDGEYLDGQYAAFGHVTEGQDIVDKIAADAEPTDDNGTIPPEKQPVITAVRIID